MTDLSDYFVVILGVVAFASYIFKNYLDFVASRRRDSLDAELRFEEIRLRKNSRKDAEDLQGDSVTSELLRRQTVLLEQILSKEPRVEVNISDRSEKPAADTGVAVPFDTSQLMRELSHSLNTPLSQIEATVLTARTSGDVDEYDYEYTLQRIEQSVDVCKTFLNAYRILTRATTGGLRWDPNSFRASIENAANLYASARHRDDIQFNIRLPDKLTGYENSFLTAAMLPLVENAVEAAPPDTEISVDSSEDSLRWLVAISNNVASAVDPSGIFVSGHTTKAGHEGLGLIIARKLIEQRGGSLEVEVLEGAVTFSLVLRKP